MHPVLHASDDDSLDIIHVGSVSREDMYETHILLVVCIQAISTRMLNKIQFRIQLTLLCGFHTCGWQMYDYAGINSGNKRWRF